MSTSASPACQKDLVLLLQAGTLAGLSDRQLIDQFLARRDAAGEAAITAPVNRHGPMVLRSAWTCWATHPTPTTPSRPRSWC